MTIQGKISVNSLYTRSINLERDISNESLISSYIPTARAKSLYSRLIDILDDKLAPRAYSLIGPYGSGKSSFSAFLAHLLSHPESQENLLAHKVLDEHGISEGEELKKHLEGTDGYLKILISGSPEPLSKRILLGLQESLTKYWSTKKGPKPDLFKGIQAAIESKATGKTVSDLFSKAQDEINKISGRRPRGLLLVIDELGKFLEYEARHYGANDIFTLQTLAESACEANPCTFLIFVMLHQSFEQYSKGLGETLKNEWAKVQGRYEEVPFLESAEQTLKIVSKAICHKVSKEEQNEISKSVEHITEILSQEKALPSVLQFEDARDLFSKCYPLHPLTSLLLPYLCQKLAQNERTLFSFLGSHEEFGLEDATSKLVGIPEYIYPDTVFDYFITNQASVISDNTTHRRWAEVLSALDRIEHDASESAIRLLKLIGLFNIIGSKGNFKPSSKLLKTIYSDEASFEKDISFLSKKSIVTYRAFNEEYRVWQGSDFDLQEEVQNQLSALGNFSLAEQLNKAQILEPIVAKKYTIKNGALRFFQPEFSDGSIYKDTFKVRTEAPRIVFFLAYGQDDESLFANKVLKLAGNRDVVVLARNSVQLKDAFSEIFALKRIEESSQILKEDPVAQKEFKERYASALNHGYSLAKSYFSQPELSDWYFDGEQMDVLSNRELQGSLSEVMEAIYDKAPSFHNELINRDKPSSQAAAGRKQLILRLIENSKEEMLGFPSDKFPPEKSMYLSIIEPNGLHTKQKGEWRLTPPRKQSSLNSVWKRLDKFAKEAEDHPKTFSEISEELQAAPYGVKAGVLPIIYLTYYLVNQNELAWFEEGKFQPGLTIEAAERFFKVPHLFSIQSFKIEGLKANLFESYKSALFGINADKKERSIIDIAKPLVKFIGDLEDYTKNTLSNSLSIKAQKLKKAFEHSKSPHKLLFQHLPVALGFESDLINSANKDSLAEFSEALTETLRELKYHYKKMLDEQLKLLCQAFHLEVSTNIQEVRKQLGGRFSGLEQHTVEKDGLKAFLRRLTNRTVEDIEWLENVLAFLASNKPPKLWFDKDKANAEYKLSDYSERILDLEIIIRTDEKLADNKDADFELIMLKSLKRGGNVKQQTIPILKSQQNSVRELKKEINNILDGQDKKLVLAVLADLVDAELGD